MTFKELSKQEFDTFANRFIPSTPYQTSTYGETMISQGYTPYYLGLTSNDKIMAATLVLIKSDGSFKYGYVPRGFLIDYTNTNLLAEFTTNLRKFLNSKSVVAIKISPLIVKNIYDANYNLIASNPNYDILFQNLKNLGFNHLGYNSFFESYKPRFEALIELKQDFYTLFQNMKKSFRTKVRSAEANGVRIHKGTYDDIAILYEQAKNKYPRNMKYFEELYNNGKDNVEIYYAKVDFDTYLKKNQAEFVKVEQEANLNNELVLNSKGKSHQRLLTKKIASDKMLNVSKAKLSEAINLMSKYPDGIIIASLIICKTKDTITIMMDAYDKKYTKFNAKHLMIWKLIEKYAKEGYKYFNLGGATYKVENDNKYYGLNNYKLGFGSKIYEYIGDFEFVTNKPLYIMYRNTGAIFKKK